MNIIRYPVLLVLLVAAGCGKLQLNFSESESLSASVPDVSIVVTDVNVTKSFAQNLFTWPTTGDSVLNSDSSSDIAYDLLAKNVDFGGNCSPMEKRSPTYSYVDGNGVTQYYMYQFKNCPTEKFGDVFRNPTGNLTVARFAWVHKFFFKVLIDRTAPLLNLLTNAFGRSIAQLPQALPSPEDIRAVLQLFYPEHAEKFDEEVVAALSKLAEESYRQRSSIADAWKWMVYAIASSPEWQMP